MMSLAEDILSSTKVVNQYEIVLLQKLFSTAAQKNSVWNLTKYTC